MSATRDKTQRHIFMFDSMYSLYKKEKNLVAAQKNPIVDLKTNLRELKELHSIMRSLIEELENLRK